MQRGGVGIVNGDEVKRNRIMMNRRSNISASSMRGRVGTLCLMLLPALLLLSSCGVIDEDLSGCVEPTEQAKLDYIPRVLGTL